MIFKLCTLAALNHYLFLDKKHYSIYLTYLLRSAGLATLAPTPSNIDKIKLTYKTIVMVFGQLYYTFSESF